MKIAVLADIHSGFVALQAVAADIDEWQPDRVVVAGDLINRGPSPAEALAFVLERAATDGWQLLAGNHERYLLEVMKRNEPSAGLDAAVVATVRWTVEQIRGTEAIAKLPTQVRLKGPFGEEIRVVHASMRHDRDNITMSITDDELRQKIAPAPAVFCCGHTHQPLIRHIDQTLVVNVGSVGMPFDGNPDASYARLEWHTGAWHAEIVRVPYDRNSARQAFFTGGLANLGPAADIILAEFDDARPYMASWMKNYAQLVLEGQVSAAESVRLHLAAKRAERLGR